MQPSLSPLVLFFVVMALYSAFSAFVCALIFCAVIVRDMLAPFPTGYDAINRQFNTIKALSTATWFLGALNVVAINIWVVLLPVSLLVQELLRATR